LAVHAAAAEAGGLAGCVEARDRLAVLAQHARLEVGLDPAERLARHRLEPDRDQRAGVRVRDLLELRRPQPVAAPGAVLGGAAELVVVPERLAAREVVVVAPDL